MEIAYNAIGPILEELKNGEINGEEAREKVRETISPMRYQDEFGPNYIFMSTYGGILLVQPYGIQMEGTNQWNLIDSNGIYIIRSLAKAAQAEPEGSFVTYHYPLPNQDQFKPKLSYVVAIPEIQAFIGTGMYMESTSESLTSLIHRQRIGFMAITLVVLLLVAVILRETTKKDLLLSDSEEKHKALYETANDAIFILDDGKIADCNPKTQQLFQYTRRQMLGKTMMEVSVETQPDGTSSIEKAHALVERANQGEPQHFEWVHCRKDGTTFYAGISLNYLKLQDKGYIQAIVRDITERVEDREKIETQYSQLKESQDKLQENHEELLASEEELRNNYEDLANLEQQTSTLAERYKLVSEASKDIILDYDGIKDELFISERFYELVGYSKNKNRVGFERIFDYVHPEDRPLAEKKYNEHILGERPYFSCEHRIKTRDGQLKWYYSRGKVSKNKDGVIVRYAGSLTDITDKKLYEEEIKKMAFNDYLTGLPNRAFIMNELEKVLKKCPQDGPTCAVFFVDIDNFKAVNDYFGHGQGDRLLKDIAEKLRSNISGENLTVSRVGGDEFIVLLDKIKDENCIEDIAKKIKEIFDDPFELQENPFYFTSSIGISVCPKDGGTVEELFKTADMAMYEAKAKGKNNYVFYEAYMGEAVKKKSQLESALKGAITNQELYLVYQPQIDIGSGSIVGLEALIRWDSAKYGLVSPVDFIPLAEETGLIYDIGDWVLDNAFMFGAKLQQQIKNYPSISINISPNQFLREDFVTKLEGLLERYKIEPQKICLEITENIFIEAFEGIVEKLTALKKLGFKIHLDDFGKAYSSFTYLKRLPIDVVKIDKLFLDGIINDDEGKERKILNAIIILAHSIGLKAVGEGVETIEQRNYLEENHCDIIQGNLLSRPVAEDVVISLLNKRSIL